MKNKTCSFKTKSPRRRFFLNDMFFIMHFVLSRALKIGKKQITMFFLFFFAPAQASFMSWTALSLALSMGRTAPRRRYPFFLVGLFAYSSICNCRPHTSTPTVLVRRYDLPCLPVLPFFLPFLLSLFFSPFFLPFLPRPLPFLPRLSFTFYLLSLFFVFGGF